MEPETTTQAENNSLNVGTTEDFHTQLVEAGGRLVVVHFHSDESNSSKIMVPKCKELADVHKDVLFLKVDIGLEDMAERYNVSMTPTFLFLKNGKEVEAITGANERRLEHLVHKLKR
ncbi:thioredoxin-2 [Halyomorpha halys]|uniref:thioredoxin-2 n=1 Tax=Halyomorpha halys TaxID=286706 RepID=UPI0006D4C8BF|nr:thioredoxin-2 [Halyomorpha halys]